MASIASDPVQMFKCRRLFIEMHEFRDDHWHQTHRWNHGLEEHLVRIHPQSSHSRWVGPHLPSISLSGMNGLRDALTAEMIVLDIEDDEQSFDAIVHSMLNGLMSSNQITREDRMSLHETLVHRLRNRNCAIVAQTQTARNEPLKHDTEEELVIRCRSEDSAITRNDPLTPDVSQEAMHIFLSDVEALTRDVVALVRLKAPIKTGFEERSSKPSPDARFFMIVLGPLCDGTTRRRAEIGEAAAALLQDDSVASVVCSAHEPEEIINAFDQRLSQLRLLPQILRPTHAGIRRRATRMLRQMAALKDSDDQDGAEQMTSQAYRWKLREEDPFKNGVSISGLMAFMQKFALPLLLGISVALVVANIDPEEYDRWFGYGHEAGSHDAHDVRPTAFDLSLHGHDVTLHFIVNDILMCLFFGLAAKELCEAFQPGGSLYPPTRTTVNVLAATVGGVVGPVLVYIGVLGMLSLAGSLDENYTFSDYAIGWGIPTATDISLAWVTALCVFGSGHPAINYLLLLAIVDDAIGLLIIAFAYPDPEKPVKPIWLLLVVVAIAVAFLLRRLRCARWGVYVFLAGPVAWVGLLYAGLHPSLALVFVVPVIPLHIEKDVFDLSSLLGDAHSHSSLTVGDGHPEGHAPLHDFEEAVKEFVDFVVLFSFGAVNAGVQVDSVGALTFVVLAALMVGKTLGIYLASVIAKALGCPPPIGLDGRAIAGIGFIASTGLTVSLFVAGEAFEQHPVLSAQAKMGALLSVTGSLLAIFSSTFHHHLKRKSADLASQDLMVKQASSNSDLHDEALEDVVVESAVRNLNIIHQTEEAIEHLSSITRTEAVAKLRRNSMTRLPEVENGSPPIVNAKGESATERMSGGTTPKSVDSFTASV